jgi:hypothetical protein
MSVRTEVGRKSTTKCIRRENEEVIKKYACKTGREKEENESKNEMDGGCGERFEELGCG